MRTKSIKTSKYKEAIMIFIFLLPAIIGLVLFQYIPIFSAVRNSLFNVNLLAPDRQTFAGFNNYIRLINDPKFLKSLLNTIYFAGLKIALQIPLSLILAIIIQNKTYGIGFFRSAFFAPTVTALSIIALIWALMYDPYNGIFNTLLIHFNLPPQPFLTSPEQALTSIVIMSVWQDVGFTMLIFLSGLQGIPKTYYEVAEIDGAGKIQQIRFITLPLLQRSILFAIVLSTVFAFKVFTPIYIMTKGGPISSTLVTVYYIYEQGFIFLDMGYASAIAVVLIIFVSIIAILQNRLLRSQFTY